MKKPKTFVVSFRATARVIDAANADLKRIPAANCKTHEQFARKLLTDYIDGKLVYLDPKERERGVKCS